ncbi:MAG: hydrogenase maturation protease [Candidatus Limnocylindrales bacterium]
MSGTLVAGIGNIFLSDDAFGCEVVRRLAGRPIPSGVKVADFGIKGIHLAYELLDGYDRLILIDAISRNSPPGTIHVLQPNAMARSGRLPDGHGMEPLAVFDYLASIGGEPVPTVIVGCEPESLDEGMGLSPTVEGAIDEAIVVVLDLLAEPAAFSPIRAAVSGPA